MSLAFHFYQKTTKKQTGSAKTNQISVVSVAMVLVSIKPIDMLPIVQDEKNWPDAHPSSVNTVASKFGPAAPPFWRDLSTKLKENLLKSQATVGSYVTN